MTNRKRTSSNSESFCWKWFFQFSLEYQWLCPRTRWQWDNSGYRCSIDNFTDSWRILVYWCTADVSTQVEFSVFKLWLFQINNVFRKDRRSWLLNQLFPRSLLEQYSLKQLISRIRTQLQTSAEQTQLSVAKEFIRIFSENTRSFAGKLFPVKFPVSLFYCYFIQLFKHIILEKLLAEFISKR